MVCQHGCPVAPAELAEAVAELGALPMPTGPDPLAEILARADAATPGPWCTDAWEIYQGEEYEPGLSAWLGETCRGTSTPEQDRADATFVAAARTDVPELVAEVKNLRTMYDVVSGRESDLIDERDGLLTRVAELEARPLPTSSVPAEVLADVVAGVIRDYDRDVWDATGNQIMALRRSLFEYRDRAEAPVGSLLGRLGEPGVEEGLLHRILPAAAEDPHDSPLHHTYATPRDLPEVTS